MTTRSHALASLWCFKLPFLKKKSPTEVSCILLSETWSPAGLLKWVSYARNKRSITESHRSYAFELATVTTVFHVVMNSPYEKNGGFIPGTPPTKVPGIHRQAGGQESGLCGSFARGALLFPNIGLGPRWEYPQTRTCSAPSNTRQSSKNTAHLGWNRCRQQPRRHPTKEPITVACYRLISVSSAHQNQKPDHRPPKNQVPLEG